MKLCDEILCNGCQVCSNVCTQGCISMIVDSEGFLRPYVDVSKCIECGLCKKSCPVQNPLKVSVRNPNCYAVINNDASERALASSGGLFILLAKWTIAHGGIVFGAAYNADFSVSHKYAQTMDDVKAFCGSKYVQSDVGTSYRDVDAFLHQGKYVLFTGTPCQIIGLKKYLKKEFENLFTVDIICHGVPSPKVWKAYIDYRAKKDNNGVLASEVCMRNKDNSWSKYEVRYRYGKSIYSTLHYEDAFMRGFIRNLYLRPSCHKCIAKGINRVSDFTLGDFWGIQKVCPSMYDDKGTSLVFVHTDKANLIWNDISKNIKYKLVDSELAVEYNSAAIVSVKCHPKRKKFFKYYEIKDFEKLIMKLTEEGPTGVKRLYWRVRGRVGRLVRFILHL